MKPSLQLRLENKLSITPELKQALHLLTLSASELQAEIIEKVESNPLLEIADPSYQPKIYQNTPTDTFCVPTNQSLRDHLLWQLNLSSLSELDCLIGTTLIHAIDEEGFLSCSLAEIFNTLHEYDVSQDQIKTVLKTIQQFEPMGCGAKDMAEYLQHQITQLPCHTPWKAHALLLVQHHLPLLAKRDYATLKRRLGLGTENLKTLVNEIKRLALRPNTRNHVDAQLYVIPDVVVTQSQDRWEVALNPDTTIPLKIQERYLPLLQNASTARERNYFKTQLKEAKWFLGSLAKRHETLLKVATYLVEQQQDFFSHGEKAIKPLTLSTVAGALDLHESTVSRITTQKYFATPRTTFALKTLLSPAASVKNPTLSQKAILAMLKSIIASENPDKPLSDNKLSQVLKHQGIHLARRTISKYRDVLMIPPYYLRKQLV